MTAQVGTFGLDYATLSNVAAADTAVVFRLHGGTYAMFAKATWSGGSLDLQALGPDGATFLSVLPAAFAADGFKTSLVLPAGQYKFVIATSSAVYANLSRIGRGAGA